VFTVFVDGIVLGNGRPADAHAVERADEIHVDHELEGAQVVGAAVAVDDAPCPSQACAVDDDAQRRGGRRLIHCRLHLVLVGHVGGGELRAPPQLFGQGLGPGGVAVHDRDHGPAGCEPPDGCLTESRRPSGDECPCLFDLHEREI